MQEKNHDERLQELIKISHEITIFVMENISKIFVICSEEKKLTFHEILDIYLSLISNLITDYYDNFPHVHDIQPPTDFLINLIKEKMEESKKIFKEKILH